MTTLTYPAKLADVVTELLDYGWSFVLQHGEDTGDSPFISIEAKRSKDIDTIRITWHTRATGNYRLFSCMVNKRDVTLTKARETITA
ncbi:hypothetical protein [Pseudarthrobacter sp. BRE9]|uniref:hypothetical protein n=1 Tax=Pseudarthrobacter sp. BRE9 TaxID=2962582 RepID=UPI002882A5CC|nr:hypothetical protein [Pseudarthrobacter sp. BRE9]MDT0171038.1 hypothetical protein [Pseudarthrobacter sp. BRE9]